MLNEPLLFQSAWWLTSPHAQTLWPVLCRVRPRLPIRRERLELPDGDFLDLDWTDNNDGKLLVLIVHGLEGSSHSHYVRGLMAAIVNRGWCGVVMHFRGCSGQPNRLARSYCAGDTADIDYVVNQLRQRYPTLPLAGVGYSLGGNALLKWLGQIKSNSPLRAAVAVSVPFLLDAAARRLNQGFSRLYQWFLLRELKRGYRAKFRRRTDAPVALDQLATLRSFYAFDHHITAPLHGYANVSDYYARASCRSSLRHICVPTLIVQASDDPFIAADAIPDAAELSPHVRLELSQNGGHVGFVGGSWPWRASYWLEQRIPAFLESGE